MDIRFRDYTIGERSGRDTFKVITDYAHYPRFNPAVVEVTVITSSDGSMPSPFPKAS